MRLNDPAARLRLLNVVVALTLLAYVAVSLWSGWRGVVGALASVGVAGLAAGIALTVANTWLRFGRWHLYLRVLGGVVPVLASFRIYVAGFALAATPGGAGEPLVRSIFLDHYGFSYARTVAAYVSERGTDILAMLIMTSIGLAAFPAGRSFILMVAALIAAFLLVVYRPAWIAKVAGAIEGRGGRAGRVLWHALETLQHASGCFRPELLVFGIVLGFLGWTANALSCLYLTHLVGHPIELHVALFIYAFSVLVGGLSFLPGGVGTAEAAMITLLILNGMPEPQAVAVTVVHRCATLWFSVLWGVYCYRRHGRRHVPGRRAPGPLSRPGPG